jgi:RNA polymerase sigma-70 factor (family 1)
MDIVERVFTSEHEQGAPQSTVDLKSLFNEFYDRLVYFSLQFVKDKDQAQDIVQDSFVKYWYQRDAVMADRTAVKNFLYATVRNASLNAVRHAKVVENYALQHGGAEPEDAPVIDAIITSEVLAGIHSAIKSLPENYRLISVMGYLDGKKNHEIADELAMSVNTVKKQKYKALQLLRTRLTPEIFALIFALIIQILK